MLAEILLPDTSQLQLIDCRLEDQILSVRTCATQSQSCCPDCGKASVRVHSTYQRTLVDLPCSVWHVQLHWTVRRFFCDNSQCSRRTFAEQLPEVAVRYARRTRRLAERQTQVAFEAGGEGGRRICTAWGLDVSGDQLLRLIRDAACTPPSTPRVLGIDDWALRKRHSYGTILVDLERHCVVDLLQDREAETVADWLRQHPQVEIVSRDRGQSYIDGVTAGAPQATQVADRFHLLRNLHAALTKVCERRAKDLKAVAREVATAVASAPSGAESDATPSALRSSPTRRECRFQQVKQLQLQDVSQRAAARETGLDRRTVARYYRLQELPPRAVTYQTRSHAAAYLPYLLERWEAGHRNRRVLFEEIQAQGFTGSYASVWRALRGVAQGGGPATQPRTRFRYSAPSNAAWLLMCPDTDLTDDEALVRAKLCAHSSHFESAGTLAQAFRSLLREPGESTLDAWLEQAELSAVPEFVRFAASLRSDYQAVKAATTLTWSNGQVEGQVHRLKLIKRQMYGRAKLDLLRQRVIGLA